MPDEVSAKSKEGRLKKSVGPSLWVFALRRLVAAIPLLFGIALITFVIIRLAPGEPIDVLLGDYPASREYVDELRARYGLDQPLHVQFLTYLGNLLQGDFGYSIRNRSPVLPLIVARLPATFLLMASAMLFACLVGLTMGIIASLKPYSTLDNLTSIAAIVGYSAPVFWLGQMLLVFLAARGWFPIQGMRSLRGDEGVIDVAWHLVLPALALSFRYSSINARMTRASMLEEFGKNYVIAARAKGLSEREVVIRHAFRNALLPVVTILGYNFGFVLSGSVLVETVFGWPGVGRLLFESLGARDTPTMIGIFMIGAAMAIIANTATDMAYAAIDPRIRNA